MTITTDDNDWLLQKIVNLVNGTDRKIPITVLVQGAFVSGNLVSVHHYLKTADDTLVVKDLLPGALIPVTESVPADIDLKNFTLSRTLQDSITQVIEEKKVWNGTPQYIHIQDAKFHNGTGEALPKQKGVFWRGQIDRVSGFYLG